MIKKIISIGLILVLVFCGGYWTAKQLVPEDAETSTGPIYATKPVTRGDIHVGVDTAGQLNASYGGGIRMPEANDPEFWSLSFIIEEYFVEEGDAIKEGDRIVRLSSTDLDTKIDDLIENLDSKKDYLAKMMGIEKSEIDSINPYDGIVINAPISGRITSLGAEEGKELEDTEGTIVTIVDDSKYIMEFKALESEYSQLSEGQNIKLKFESFEGFYDATITELNKNAIPNDDGITYIHIGKIEGKNPGLVQSGMQASINLLNGDSMVNALKYKGTVDSYVDEESIYKSAISSDKLVVTEVLIDQNDYVQKNDPIVKLAGADVRIMIQERLDDIRTAERSLQKAEDMKENLFVTSPMDGVISDFWRQKGEKINCGDWFGDVFNTNDMRVWTQVDDIDIINIKQDAPVIVTVDALPNETFDGKVSRISQSKDRNGLINYSVDIEVSGSGDLRPGMQANCFIDAGKAENTLLIPIEAVFEDDGIPKVEILNEDGTVENVTIETGLMNDRYVEVLDGLEEGQQVVTGSSSDLLPSEHIKNNDTILPNNTGNSDDENSSNKEN